MFKAETYTQRRDNLKQRLKTGVALFPGNRDSSMNYAGNIYPFRQDSSFLYYFGLDQPELSAIIDLDAGTEIIFGDELTIDHIVWMGDLPTISDRALQSGVHDTRPLAALADVLATTVHAGRTIHYLPPYRPENVMQLQAFLGWNAEKVQASASVDLIQAVVAMRSIKSDEEIVEIENAVNTSVDMHVAGMAMARPGLGEADIAAEVERIARAAGGRTSFPVIATTHGEILHNLYQRNTLQAGDLFLLDAGAENPMHYAGDLSSTFPVSPAFTARQKTIYEISLAAHSAAVARLAPGVSNRDVHFTAARVIAEGMKDLGLMTGNVDDALHEGAHAMFFPCGVGHMMGLDVHDMEDLGEQYVGYAGQSKSTQFGLKSLRLGRSLEPGFVLTVEPGIYFIPKLIDHWGGQRHLSAFLNYEKINQWRDFGGIRNEEDYLITESGKRLLGKKKPMTIAEVEAVRAG